MRFDRFALGRFETIHFYDAESGDFIAQNGARFSYLLGSFEGSFTCALPAKLRPFHLARLTRRLARLDKGTCVHLRRFARLVIFYQGVLFTYDLAEKVLRRVRGFAFRNPLFMGTQTLDGRSVYFGEYFANDTMRAVSVFGSQDGGDSWDEVYRFPAGSIWHVHGVHHDPWTDHIWICTGDRDGECRIVMLDRSFREIETFGDGSQAWRAVTMMFLEDRVVWGMDSPLAPCRVMSFDRASHTLKEGQPMPGPVWYARQFGDGHAVLQTATEHLGQPGVQSNHAHLFATRDFEKWTEIASWRKDRWPNRTFLHGLVSFSDGPQRLDRFAMNGQAISGLDGVSGIAGIDKEALDCAQI